MLTTASLHSNFATSLKVYGSEMLARNLFKTCPTQATFLSDGISPVTSRRDV
jgi:hypothetical protein